jgi:uncharacterized protein YukE
MAISYSALMTSNPGDFTTAAGSWDSWEQAVTGHSKDLKTQVDDPLDSTWKGTAADSAQSNLMSVHGDMAVSSGKISKVGTALNNAATTFAQAKADLQKASGPLANSPYFVDTNGVVQPKKSPVDPQDQSKWSATVTKVESDIKAALAKADSADQAVATALSALMPPSKPQTGPGTNLSSDPGSDSGSNGSSGNNGGSADSSGSTAVSSVTAQQAMALGQKMAAARGWTGQQFTCLQKLWVKESGWNAAAKNPSSGAFGIPQSLPADKMASAGADWQTNPATQIKWGLDYIAGRYGNPCGAWAHEVANNWY